MSDTAALLEQQPTYEIPADLDMSPTERLLLIADIIERTPQKWDQDTYWPETMDNEIADLRKEAAQIRYMSATGRGNCGSGMCVCGWGIFLTPHEQVTAILDAIAAADGYASFESVGAKLLGLSEDLAYTLFTEWTLLGLNSTEPVEFAAALRIIAELPEPRTLADAEVALQAAGYEEWD